MACWLASLPRLARKLQEVGLTLVNQPTSVLLRDQQWRQLNARLAQLGPVEATRLTSRFRLNRGTALPYRLPRVLLLLADFARARPHQNDRQDGSWTPKELTGAIPFDEDSEDD